MTQIPLAGRPSWISRLDSALIALCLFAMVVGTNWATSERFGSDIPDWDQWDAEGINLLLPWCDHSHFVAHLFQPQNEHRIVITKLQNLGVILAGGQWDQRAETFFNAMLHGLIAVALWRIGRRWIPKRGWQFAYYLVLAVLYTLPVAWQNVLGGLHNVQYWLLALSLAAIVSLPFSRPGSAAWFGGVLAAAAALLTMASGFFAAIIVGVLVAWQLWQQSTTLRASWLTLTLMTALTAVGFATRIEVPWHEALKAKSIHDFIFTIVRSLEWPIFDHDWTGVILWAPWTIIAGNAVGRLLRRDRAQPPATRGELVVIGIGGWVLLQLLATGYARGAGAGYPASRYMDTLMFASAANALALVWLMGGLPSPQSVPARAAVCAPTARPRRNWVTQTAAYVLGIVWVVAFGFGLNGQYDRTVRHVLPDTKEYYLECEAHLRSYLATNDRTELVSKIPYPNADALIERLSHRCLADRMPVSVRPPLPLRDSATSRDAFQSNHAVERLLATAPRRGLSPNTPALASRPTWGSYASVSGAANEGEWRSEPLTAPLAGWLRFETAGNVGEPGVAIELHDARTDAKLATVVPTKEPHESWRSAYVRAPRRPFVVVARDTDPQRWIAFSAPVEMSNLSYWTWQLMKNGFLIAKIAAAVALLLAVLSLRTHSAQSN